jgi:hypothetical protein
MRYVVQAMFPFKLRFRALSSGSARAADARGSAGSGQGKNMEK